MISIIVPIYNTETYLRECVDSILAQTYTDFELLLIDDGSKDSSGVICDEYAAKDSRVRVFHKENGGVSSARNLGLNNAKGEYLIVIDADDYWCRIDALEQLYNVAVENNVDIVRGEYKAVDKNGTDLFARPITQSKEKIANQIIDNVTFLSDAICGEFFFVLCLVKKSALDSIRYNDKRSFLEDMELLSTLMLKPLSCIYIPFRFYAYRKIENSASNVPKVKNLKDSFEMCYMFNNLSNKTNDQLLCNFYTQYSIMMYYWTLDTITLDAYFSRRKELIIELGLNELQKQVYNWSKRTDDNIPIIIKVSPIIGVWVFKFRHFIGGIVRRIKNR
ncbi:MAG: glycosyltransferase family 2 protein [Alistipes sp.]|nr:glycosyltransferase family 2 protein [Alistipes sp.]